MLDFLIYCARGRIRPLADNFFRHRRIRPLADDFLHIAII